MAVFELRLARELGATREQLLDMITQKEFLDWLALESFSPIFEPWISNAITQQTLNAIGGNNVALQEFVPYKLPKKRRSSVGLKAAMQARIKRQQNGPD